MIDLRPLLAAGDGVFWNQTCAEPTPLVDALLDQVAEIGDIRAFVGMTLHRRLTQDPPQQLHVVSYGGLGELRRLARSGRLEVVPAHYSALAGLFAARRLPGDVALIQVSPPDSGGWCTLGLGVDYIADALPHARAVIAEINAQMPATAGAPRIHVDSLTASIRTDRPLVQAPEPAASEVEQRIAAHVAGLVQDGDTVQIGVGALPGAILDGLTGHRDLGLHTGLIGDSVLRLFDSGALTGARKEIDTGLMITGAAFGGPELYGRIGGLPIEFRPSSYTHSPQVLGRLRSLVAVNSALEVDLNGDVGAERVGEHWVGAIGGQVDFSRAAAHGGGRSVIALRSTIRDASTIRATLAQGAPTTVAADIDHVVTEHGVADLRGRTAEQRAEQLIAIAAPEHRRELSEAWAATAAGGTSRRTKETAS
ncbi:4-hydroxybutyrate CoA-transferase [Nakamurella sp. YIM 132087]|uniref:4-hydroxybutyrate CoA-transferase n=1 Tax=Nakamurella alba TaxID=2665158 RepID=A0A7K1FEJ1_9ACTN|nr:acetyl-CoA hydrolase/transferase C-terminal domain-containing protein [Nakamurella alba]MTD12490.1 4-hydroxybutyrate CoA-transferase [Nakamurella alba]